MACARLFRLFIGISLFLFSACEGNGTDNPKAAIRSAASDNSSSCSAGKNCSSEPRAFSVSQFESQGRDLPEFGGTCVLQILRRNMGMSPFGGGYDYIYFGTYSCNGRPIVELGELPGRDYHSPTFDLRAEGFQQVLSYSIDFFSKRGLEFKSCTDAFVDGKMCIFQSTTMTRE